MVKKQIAIVGAMVGLIFMGTGCASIINGSKQKVPISSTPDGAKVTIYDEQKQVVYSANTPCTVDLKRGTGWFKGGMYNIVIEKAGCDTTEVKLEPKVGGWYIGGNLFFGGLIGYLAVDPATGAMWTLTPKKIETSLTEKQASLPKTEIREPLPRPLTN